MTSSGMKNERFNQLGLPPMELAESSTNSRNNKGLMLRCLLPSLQKIIIILLLTIFGAGTYILLSKMLSNHDCPGNTQIVLIKENNDIPINSPMLKIIGNLNITKENEISRTKRAIEQVPDNFLEMNDFNSLTINDDQLQRAREIIMKHDMVCNEQTEQENCKDLVTKLREIAKNNDTINSENPKTDDMDKNDKNKHNTPTKVNKQGTSKKANLNIDKEVQKINHSDVPQSSSTANNCLLNLFKNYPKNLLASSSEYLTSAENDMDKNRFHPIFKHSPHIRSTESSGQKVHPQDVDILLSFLTRKSESIADSTNRQVAATREISCPADTLPCLNGVACVNKTQWCDGYVDCADVSDEARCNCKSRVDKSRLCDGYFDCPFGEDEMGCHGCSENTFSCEDKSSHSSCFTKEQRCNKVVECPNHKDEIECNMLSPTLLKKPIFSTSNTEGFLHRNFKGEWYPVCKNPYMWAHDVCRSETGLIIRPPGIDLIQIDPMLNMKYISNDHGGLLETSDTCFNYSAVYVTCPKILCGIRVKSTSQLLKENIAIENHLFGRNKRFHESNHPYPLKFYPNRWKRNVENATNETNHENNFDIPKTEEAFGKMRNKRMEARVVGGKPSQPAAWPWVVAVYRNGIFHCGGVVLTHSWVISAAHCVNKFWDNYYEIQVGMLRRFSFSPQEQSYKVTHIIVNQYYSQTDMKNDLSLLRVEPTIQFNRWVRPICLPSPDVAGQEWLWGPSPGTICTAVGWGATMEHGPDPDHLREVELPIWDKCIHTEDRAGNEICAGLVKGGKDACQGDSGGPLLCKNPLNSQQWYLVGIVSHGDGCAREGEPGVYTRISLFVHWIRHHISSNSLPLIKPIQQCPGFKCESGIPKCLPNTRKCDRIVDCLDGEDEVNCEFSKLPTNLDNLLSPKNNVIEELFISKEAKLNLHKKEHKKVYKKDNTPTTDKKATINRIEGVSTLPRTIAKSIDGNIDFEHASTIEISIPKSSEDLSEEDKLTTVNQLYSTTTHEYLSNNYKDLETTTLVFNGEDFDRKSPVIERLKETTTEKDTFIEPNENVTERFEESTPTFTTEEEKFNTIETTTHINVDETNSMTTHSSLESDQNDKEQKKSNVTLELLPSSHLNHVDEVAIKTNFDQKENSMSNKTNGTITAIKQRPSFDDKSTLLNKTEYIVSSELQPATVRRKPRIPNDFQCQRIYQLIPFQLRCNRQADCEDGTDELECSCLDYLLTFDKQLICDGVVDCADGHDEYNCFSCQDDQFLCKQSQRCLPLKNVCDGKQQCPQGEDELDCFTLTNGKEIYYDLDERPSVNLEGFVTKKTLNDWHVVCDNKLTLEEQEHVATHICRYLGFSSANKFHIKYIRSKEFEKRSITYKQNVMERIPIHFLYRSANEKTGAESQVVIEKPQVLKEECLPNITKTCYSLYVYCDHSLFSSFYESDNIFLRKTETTHKKIWPWIAKVFVEGEYRCIGVLINLSWVLVSDSCLWDSTLSDKYVTVALGSHRTLDTINGMYEQTYQVDSKKDIYRSKVILLHLKQVAHYSNYVKPMIVTSSFTDFDSNSTCVAIGQDNNNETISINLEETNQNCDSSNRCFFRKSKKSICSQNTLTGRHWAGIISCHTEEGWFPAASFVDSRGECGLGDHINATYIENIKHEIKHLKSGGSLPSSVEFDGKCEGIRCGRGRCITLKSMCDGVRNCEDGNDESEDACYKKKSVCSHDPYKNGCECSAGQLKCRNGKCVSKELFRDGNDDCGDRTDEPGQSTCSHYLARVMPSRLCDGILHCHDRSDEDPMFCKCFAKKSFKCGTTQPDEDYCVAIDMVCDGVKDCPNGEDEKTCIGLNRVPGTPHGTGQVIMRSHGVWFSKCYPKQNHTRSELEAICAELGFISGHAKQIHVTENHVLHKHNSLVIDRFNDITLNNNTKIKMRNTPNPIADAVFDKQMENCYPVLIECL